MDHHPLILAFISIFGDVIAGSLNVFNYFRVKLLKEDKHLTLQAESDTVQPFNRILTAHSEESYCFSLCKILMLMFIVSLSEVLMLSSAFIVAFYADKIYIAPMTVVLIILEALISVPVLKYKIDNHQITAIIIIIIGILFICVLQSIYHEVTQRIKLIITETNNSRKKEEEKRIEDILSSLYIGAMYLRGAPSVMVMSTEEEKEEDTQGIPNKKGI